MNTPQEARQALQAALAQGYIKADLIFVEFAAQPLPDGIFRKISAHRIGNQVFMAPGGFSDHWLAKAHDEIGLGPHWPLAPRDMEENTHIDILTKAFQIANLEYGRADFGLVDGKPQIYEINSNPIIGDIKLNGPSQFRKSYKLRAKNFTRAMQKIDTPSTFHRVYLDAEEFISQRRNDLPSLGFHRALK